MALRRRGSGPPIVLVHGNSCSSRCYVKQFDSYLAERFALLALDLPGHGASPPPAVPEQGYSLPGHAGALVAAAASLGAEDAVFVGWSMGGHVVLEAAPLLPRASGFLIFGTPPIARFDDFVRAVTDDPAGQAAFSEAPSEQEVRALLQLFFRSGTGAPEMFVEDFANTDPRARSLLGASVASGKLRDEVQVVGRLAAPLAVLHGADERVIVNRRYLDEMVMPSLWRGSVQEIPKAGHAAQWENPERFNSLLEAFALDCARHR